MITNKEYMQIISEVYDLSDYTTKKKMLFCNEADKSHNVERVVAQIYTYIKENIVHIDFGTIPKSKGVINKIENYEQMISCLDAINELVKTYKDPTNTVKEIYTAIDNIKKHEREFTKAFALNIEFPIMLYNMTVLSIVSSISLLIASSIEFIKNGHDSFNAAFDKSGYHRSKDHLTFEYLVQFNNNCANKTIDKLIDGCIKNNIVATKEMAMQLNEESLSGLFADLTSSGLGIGLLSLSAGASGPIQFLALVIAVGLTAYSFCKLFGRMIAFYLRTQVKVADWFALQAELLKINAENLKYRDDPKGESHKKTVYQRQIKWVNRFNKIANFLMIKDCRVNDEMKKEPDFEPKMTIAPPSNHEIAASSPVREKSRSNDLF